MKPLTWIKPRCRMIFRGVLSAPVFAKIMGIGLMVAMVFGAVTLAQIRGSISLALHQLQEQRAWSLAQSLATGIERPLTIGDLYAVQERLVRARRTTPDVRYLIVQDSKGHIVNHTFPRAVPRSLARFVSQAYWPEDSFRVLATPEGNVFHVCCLILDGNAGALHLGMSSRMITRELAAFTRSVLWSLLLCAVIGAGLAVLLTYVLTRPIRHLVEAAIRIRDGDFTTRSEVYFEDEIGRLARAFNEAAEGLERLQNEAANREQARRALIHKIVDTQEDERRNISRELHDELGQSLLALLLAVQTRKTDNGLPARQCLELEERIRAVIDEVRRLAWGMHPSILDDYGLDSALSRHIEEVRQHTQVAIDYQYTALPGKQRLPREVEVTLYRVTQEALTNVLRHAKATQCSMVILHRREEVTLLIEDNGQGFDPEAVRQRHGGGLGLTGMQERVSILGGTCEIQSRRTTGTTVHVRIALQEGAVCQSES